MGRKSSSKLHQQNASQPPPPAAPARNTPLIIGIIVIVLVAVGLLVFRGGQPAEVTAESTPKKASEPAAQTPSADAVPASAENQQRADAIAAFGPRQQTDLPPIPFRGYAPPRPADVVSAAYHFAAEHPEILSYVPCFCGCERSGHSGNHDCFVKARAATGDVIEWDEHGMECAVCIDVATRSRQMYTSGASAKDIRAAIEKEYASKFPSMTPTAHPPAHGQH
jgi:hypothetical protein